MLSTSTSTASSSFLSSSRSTLRWLVVVYSVISLLTSTTQSMDGNGHRRGFAEAFVITKVSPSYVRNSPLCNREKSISVIAPTLTTTTTTITSATKSSKTSLSLSYSMMVDTSLTVATIDSDIASIPTDQFGLVFAGGIAVMVGGVLSAIMVGFLLEKGDLYASVAAESYVQSADDEAFWKSLSDEEQVKARELLDKIKTSNNNDGGDGGDKSSNDEAVPATTLASTDGSNSNVSGSSSSKEGEATSKPVEQSKPKDMFSDY